jgi:hypothetical protein
MIEDFVFLWKLMINQEIIHDVNILMLQIRCGNRMDANLYHQALLQ